MASSSGHGRHLLAAQRALAKQLEEIEEAARRGRAPGGGPPLAPLPGDLWDQLAPPLARLGELGESIARRNAPQSMAAAARAQSPAATMRWLTLLLRRLEETLEEMDAETIARKFGPFPDPEEQARLRADRAEMQAALEAAQQLLERRRADVPAEKRDDPEPQKS